MFFVLFVVAVITAAYFLKSHYNYWQKRGVPGPKPLFIFGNLKDNFFARKSPAQVYSDIYKKYENCRLVGIFRATTPTLIIRDPDLIKDITVKSFKKFHDNDIFLDKEIDPLAGRNPFFQKGAEWKNTRTRLTPSFTSGKMKLVYPLVEEVSKKFIKYIESQSAKEGCKLKEVCMRFTLNNVGTCAFGIDAKCFEEENPEFKQIADRFLTPEGFQTVKIFLISIIPYLAKLISIKFVPNDVEDNLCRLVRDVLNQRKNNNIVRNDFLNAMNELSLTQEDFKDVDVVAQAAGFLADGYETSSVVMHFLLFELAKHPEKQEKLRDEIDRAFNDNGTLTFDTLHALPYLDACLNESLRLHPPLGSLNKVCTERYTYEPTENDVITKPFVIEPGTSIILPLYALHRDPKYFKNPDDFEPEIFFKDGKADFPKYAYLPFGEGPRACLGQRFGIMQVKIGVAYLVRHFRLTLNRKTKLPIVYDPMYFITIPKDPIFLDFEKI